MKHAQTQQRSKMSVIVSVLMALKGATQDEMAQILGVHPTTIGRRLKSESAKWTVAETELLAEYFGVPMATFFADPAGIWHALGLEEPTRSPGWISGPDQPSLFDQEPEQVIDLRDPTVSPPPAYSLTFHAAA